RNRRPAGEARPAAQAHRALLRGLPDAQERPADRGQARARLERFLVVWPQPRHRHARPCAGHPRLLCSKQDVDGRDKTGHDSGRSPLKREMGNRERRTYSITSFCSRMILAQLSISALMYWLNSSGELAIDSNICGAMNFCWNAGSARILRTSALIFATTSGGVPPVVARPNQVPAS